MAQRDAACGEPRAQRGHKRSRGQALRASPPRPWDTIPDKLPDGRETLKGWTRRWLAERAKRGHKSGRSEESCLRTWVWPRIGHLAVAAVTYPPAGIRGVAGATRASGFGRIAGYHASARDEI